MMPQYSPRGRPAHLRTAYTWACALNPATLCCCSAGRGGQPHPDSADRPAEDASADTRWGAQHDAEGGHAEDGCRRCAACIYAGQQFSKLYFFCFYLLFICEVYKASIYYGTIFFYHLFSHFFAKTVKYGIYSRANCQLLCP